MDQRAVPFHMFVIIHVFPCNQSINPVFCFFFVCLWRVACVEKILILKFENGAKMRGKGEKGKERENQTELTDSPLVALTE